MHDMYMHANTYLPASLSVNSLLTATATIRKKSSSPAGLSIVSCFLFVYSIELLLSLLLLLLLVSRCWCCCWYTVHGIVCVVLVFYAGSGFVSTTTTITLQNSFTFALTFYLPLTPAHHSHIHIRSLYCKQHRTPVCWQSSQHLSLPFSNRSRYSYIVLWKCIAALKCNRWSPSNSRLFVLFLFVLAAVLLFMLPPLALAGGVHSLFSAALELFIEMLAPFWLEIVFFSLASLGFCTLGAKRTEYSGYCLRLGT